MVACVRLVVRELKCVQQSFIPRMGIAVRWRGMEGIAPARDGNYDQCDISRGPSTSICSRKRLKSDRKTRRKSDGTDVFLVHRQGLCTQPPYF